MSSDAVALLILFVGFPAFALVVVWFIVFLPRRKKRLIATEGKRLASELGYEVLEPDRIGAWGSDQRYREVRWGYYFGRGPSKGQTTCECILRPGFEIPFGVMITHPGVLPSPVVRVIATTPEARTLAKSVQEVLLENHPFQLREWWHVDIDKDRLRVVLPGLQFSQHVVNEAFRCLEALAERVEAAAKRN